MFVELRFEIPFQRINLSDALHVLAVNALVNSTNVLCRHDIDRIVIPVERVRTYDQMGGAVYLSFLQPTFDFFVRCSHFSLFIQTVERVKQYLDIRNIDGESMSLLV